MGASLSAEVMNEITSDRLGGGGTERDRSSEGAYNVVGGNEACRMGGPVGG